MPKRAKKKYSPLKRQTPITDRQKDVLAFLASFRKENNQGPTFSEVAKGIGASKKGINGTLDGLRRRGLITWAPRVARSLALVERPPSAGKRSTGHMTPFATKLPGDEDVNLACRVIRSRISTLKHEIQALEHALDTLTRDASRKG